MTFEQRGGTLGRAPDNDWVLPDPERFVSSRHVSIGYRDGRYYVTDLSLNGLLVNGHKLGQGNSTVLSDGDVLGIGEYEVRCSMTAAPAPAYGAIPAEPEPPAFLPEGALGFEPVLPEPGHLQTRPVSHLPDDLIGPFGGEPLTESYPGIPGELPPQSTSPPMRDDAARIHEPFLPPQATPEIPENWWEAPAVPASPPPTAAPPPVEPPQPAAAPPPRAPVAAPQPAAPAPSPEDTGLLRAALLGEPAAAALEASAPAVPFERPRPAAPPVAPPVVPPPAATPVASPPPLAAGDAEVSMRAFLRGAGLPASAVEDLSGPEVLELAGQLLRQVVGGLRALLAGRTSIKQEARLEMTTLRATENNPLKFTVSDEDALRHLLRRDPQPGFLGPLAAVDEVMRDLKAHQVATLAGLEATLKGMFQRFDPARLEREFIDRSLLGTLVPGHRKARCWDLFGAEFRRITQEAE
ncbi:MAG: type VI secretion system-associated FHA domain protein TagH, partial [Gammaproteobacteria bacterium]|nr:type VI secretion system-associated FHA domain protein TagH [Gammaproteobacteria bacterium]